MKYGAILADPPWSYEMRSDKGYDKSPEAHYDTMPTDDIAALPVRDLAARDCLLFMWSTWPHLDQAMAVMSAWGFTYKTGGAWFKKTVTGKSAFGTGYLFRSSTEPFLIGTIGRPEARNKSQRNEIITEIPDAIEGLRREHSRKPPQAREILDTLFPQYFKAELFGRESWAGADVWGNQADKFGDAA
jgi:N6-adenosine-specific RNA methylase IME4